jgi:O-antigen/teichoic acid export membrane protein
VRDSFLTGVAQGLDVLGQFVQLLLITRLLGLEAFGTFVLIVSFVVLVQQFFDVRVDQATIAFGARKIGRDPRGAAGVVQLSYLVDLLTGVLGFAVVVALTPVAGPGLVGHENDQLILLYAFTLLASTVDTTSSAVLRLLDRFGVIAGYALWKEALRIIALTAALAIDRSLEAVVIALLIHDIVAAATNVTLASRAFRKASSSSWFMRSALGAIRNERGAMLRMIFHTNLIAYSRVAQTQLPALILGLFHGSLVVGVYKIGTIVAGGLAMLTDPAQVAVFPRVARLWSEGRRSDVLRLVRDASKISVPVMGFALLMVVLIREPLLALVGGDEARAAGTVLLLAALTYSVNGALFWNSPILLATGGARTASSIGVFVLALQLSLLFPLGIRWGAEGAAVALLVARVTGNTWMTVAALQTLREPEKSQRARSRVINPISEDDWD